MAKKVQRGRRRLVLTVSVEPALLAAVSDVAARAREPRSHTVERLLWAAMAEEKRLQGRSK